MFAPTQLEEQSGLCAAELDFDNGNFVKAIKGAKIFLDKEGFTTVEQDGSKVKKGKQLNNPKVIRIIESLEFVWMKDFYNTLFNDQPKSGSDTVSYLLLI